MFTLQWTEEAQARYAELKERAEAIQKGRKLRGKTKSSKQEGLFKQVHKTVTLLQTNPKHPSLKTHEYESIPNPYDKNAKVFEAYAQNQTPGAYRVFWCYGPTENEITIIAITAHP